MRNEIDSLSPLKELEMKVPEGYFEDLKARLELIPSSGAKVLRPRLWERLKPLAALAASLALIASVGTAVLKLSTEKAERLAEESVYENLLYSSPFASEELGELAYEGEGSVAAEGLSDEDIASYLAASGIPAETLYMEYINY